MYYERSCCNVVTLFKSNPNFVSVIGFWMFFEIRFFSYLFIYFTGDENLIVETRIDTLCTRFSENQINLFIFKNFVKKIT